MTEQEIKKIVDTLFDYLDHADFSNGNVIQGTDEGQATAWMGIERLKKEWNALYTSEGKEQVICPVPCTEYTLCTHRKPHTRNARCADGCQAHPEIKDCVPSAKPQQEKRFTMIKNGCEYPIVCWNGNHYYIADSMRCDEPFEKCNGNHPDFGDDTKPQELEGQNFMPKIHSLFSKKQAEIEAEAKSEAYKEVGEKIERDLKETVALPVYVFNNLMAFAKQLKSGTLEK